MEGFRWERTVPATPAGLPQLLQHTPPDVPGVLEPTGRYSLSVTRAARAAGREVLLASPRKAKAFLQSRTARAQTDRLDSQGLARYAASRPATEPLPPYPIKREPEERLDQLLTARRGIVAALTRLEQRVGELPYAAAPLRQAIADLQARRAELDQAIAPRAGDPALFPAVAQLRAVPGIGPVIAAAVGARLTARRFHNAAAFVAYIGLDIGVILSGRRKGERGLTKQGDAELRRLFYLAARANLRCRESPFKDQFHRERAQGLSKTAVFNAVARKLARVCWSLVHHGTAYQAMQLPPSAARPAAGAAALPARGPDGRTP